MSSEEDVSDSENDIKSSVLSTKNERKSRGRTQIERKQMNTRIRSFSAERPLPHYTFPTCSFLMKLGRHDDCCQTHHKPSQLTENNLKMNGKPWSEVNSIVDRLASPKSSTLPRQPVENNRSNRNRKNSSASVTSSLNSMSAVKKPEIEYRRKLNESRQKSQDIIHTYGNQRHSPIRREESEDYSRYMADADELRKKSQAAEVLSKVLKDNMEEEKNKLEIERKEKLKLLEERKAKEEKEKIQLEKERKQNEEREEMENLKAKEKLEEEEKERKRAKEKLELEQQKERERLQLEQQRQEKIEKENLEKDERKRRLDKIMKRIKPMETSVINDNEKLSNNTEDTINCNTNSSNLEMDNSTNNDTNNNNNTNTKLYERDSLETQDQQELQDMDEKNNVSMEKINENFNLIKSTTSNLERVDSCDSLDG